MKLLLVVTMYGVRVCVIILSVSVRVCFYRKLQIAFPDTGNAPARIKTDLRFPKISQPHYQHLYHLHQLHSFM